MSIEADAKNLRIDFEKRSLQELLDQQILGILCDNNLCGELTETQASLLLNRIVEGKKDETAATEMWESKWTNRIGAATALVGSMIAFIGLFISYFSLRTSRSAVRKSEQNKANIASLENVDR